MCWVAIKSNEMKGGCLNNHGRSSSPEVFYKKAVLRNFAKLTGKHLRQSLFFGKVAGLSPATLLKKRLWHSYFSCEYCEICKNTFSYRIPPVAASVMRLEMGFCSQNLKSFCCVVRVKGLNKILDQVILVNKNYQIQQEMKGIIK